MKPNPMVFFVSILLIGINSCITPKEARQLKKSTKDWRESPAILSAYADSPLAGTFLTLRENKKFEHTSSGMFRTFEAGTWTCKNDTINLYYVDNTIQFNKTQRVFINRKTSTLIFENDTAFTPIRFRIMINTLP